VLRLGGIQESCVQPLAIRERRALVRARKKFVEQRTKYKNEVRSLLNQAGMSAPSGLFSEDGWAFLAELDVGDPTGFLLENWLALIDEINAKLERFDRRIQQAAASVEAVDYRYRPPAWRCIPG
jgi:transposase